MSSCHSVNVQTVLFVTAWQRFWCHSEPANAEAKETFW